MPHVHPTRQAQHKQINSTKVVRRIAIFHPLLFIHSNRG